MIFCLWKRLGGTLRKHKQFIPLTGLIFDLSSSQTRAALFVNQNRKLKKMFDEFSMARQAWFSTENSSLYCASKLVFTTKQPFFLFSFIIYIYFYIYIYIFFFNFCFILFVLFTSCIRAAKEQVRDKHWCVYPALEFPVAVKGIVWNLPYW